MSKPGPMLLPKKWEDRLGLPALLLLCLWAYSHYYQVNPPHDAAVFLGFQQGPFHPVHPHHPAFSMLFGSWMAIGKALGINVWHCGQGFVWFFTALSLFLFYHYLRRVKIPAGVRLLYTALLAWCAPVIENATCAELYAPALAAGLAGLHALRSLEEGETFRRKLGLWFSALAVFTLHTGLAPWVLALYLTRAWQFRDTRTKALQSLAAGGAIALLGMAWAALGQPYLPGAEEDGASFFSTYWMRGEAPGWWRLLSAPVVQWTAYGGLLFFPLLLGAKQWRRENPLTARFALLSTVFFLLTYAFWITDLATFYLLLFPLWAALAARGLPKLTGSFCVAGPALAALAVYAVFFMGEPLSHFPPHQKLGERLYPEPGLLSVLAVLLFYAGLAFSFYSGGKLQEKAHPSRKSRLLFAALALALLSLQMGAYLPRAKSLLNPNEATKLLLHYQKMVEGPSRFVHHLWPPLAQSRLDGESLSLNPSSPEKIQQLDQWLQEEWEGTGPPLYCDGHFHYIRRDIQAQGLSLNLEDFVFEEIPREYYPFYRIRRP